MTQTFYKNFGYGFYCTNLEKQAKRWTLTKNGSSIVSNYSYTEDKNLRPLCFDEQSGLIKVRKDLLKEEFIMEYKFYGWQGANIAPCVEQMNDEERRLYGKIKDPRMLYDFLSEIWCEYTCAPRMRQDWSAENKTLGQCSITAFLAQDIFGGEVYGILREGGNYHCYNVVGDCKFDLTSEQFGNEKLDYTENPRQLREVHFAKEEKKQRYEYLKEELRKVMENI